MPQHRTYSMKTSWTEKLKNSLLYWENECDAGRAQSADVKGALNTAKRIFKENGYEFCAHNAAILGSKRYAKDKIHGIDVLITEYQYKLLRSVNDD